MSVSRFKNNGNRKRAPPHTHMKATLSTGWQRTTEHIYIYIYIHIYEGNSVSNDRPTFGYNLQYSTFRVNHRLLRERVCESIWSVSLCIISFQGGLRLVTVILAQQFKKFKKCQGITEFRPLTYWRNQGYDVDEIVRILTLNWQRL